MAIARARGGPLRLFRPHERRVRDRLYCPILEKNILHICCKVTI